MRTVLDKSCRENENTHFMFSNFFSANCAVYEIMSKYVVETEGLQMTSQYGAYALRAGSARLHARMRMHTPTLPGTHMDKHAQTCTHSPIYNNYCFSSATTVSWTRLSVTLYGYCLYCSTLRLHHVSSCVPMYVYFNRVSPSITYLTWFEKKIDTILCPYGRTLSREHHLDGRRKQPKSGLGHLIGEVSTS